MFIPGSEELKTGCCAGLLSEKSIICARRTGELNIMIE